MGFVLGDIGRHEDARAATKRAIKLNPSLSRAHANLSLERAAPSRRAALRPRAMRDAGVVEGERARPLQPRPRVPAARATTPKRCANTASRSTAARIAPRAAGDGRGASPAARSRGRDRAVRHLIGIPRRPKLWNERGVALHQAGASRTRGTIAARSRSIRRTRSPNNLGVSSLSGRDRGGARRVPRRARGSPDFRGAAQPRAPALQRRRFQHALEAYRQVLAEHPESGRVERRRPRAGELKSSRTRATRSPARSRPARLRRAALQPELHAVEPRRLRRRAARDQARARARSVLRRAEVRARDRPRVRRSGPHGAPGSRRRHRNAVAEFNFDPAPRHAVHRAGPGPAAPAPAAPPPATRRLAPTICRRATRPRVGGGQPRARARRRPRRGGRCSATYSRSRACTARRSSAIAARADAIPVRRARRRGAGAAGAGPARRGAPLAEGWLTRDVDDVDARSRRLADGPSRRAAGALTARGAPAGRRTCCSVSGDMHVKLGDVDGAIEAYRTALELDATSPRSGSIWSGSTQGRRLGGGGARWARRSTPCRPTPTRRSRSPSCRADSAARAAVGRLVDLLQRDPYNFDALALGAKRCSMSRPTRARAFPRVLRFDPEHVGALFFEGVVLARRTASRGGERWGP